MPNPLPWGQKRHSRQPWPPVLRREATGLGKQPQSCGCGCQVTWMAEDRAFRNPGYARVAKASVPCPRQARVQPLWEALLVALPQLLFLSMSLKCHPVNTHHSNPCLPTAAAICIQTTLKPPAKCPPSCPSALRTSPSRLLPGLQQAAHSLHHPHCIPRSPGGAQRKVSKH